MPQKPKQLDWETYINSLNMAADVQVAMAQMESMTARELYEMGSYTNAVKYIVNRPVNHAMHGTEGNYGVDPVNVMRNALIDGRAYYKVESQEYIQFDKYVVDAIVDVFSNRIDYLMVCYPVEVDDGKTMYWWASYERTLVGECLYTTYYLTDSSDVRKEDLSVEDQYELIDIPYVCAVWNEGVSIIDEARTALIRLEVVARVIGEENMDNRVRYLVGGDDITKIGSAPRRWGRPFRILPPNSSVENPASDTAAINLLTHEEAELWNNIEKSTGVVSTEKLATLSGVSRVIAEKPLLMLCDNVRASFMRFIYDVYELLQKLPTPVEEPEYAFKSMSTPPTYDDPVRLVETLDRALEKGAIDSDEWISRVRWVLGLMKKQ